MCKASRPFIISPDYTPKLLHTHTATDQTKHTYTYENNPRGPHPLGQLPLPLCWVLGCGNGNKRGVAVSTRVPSNKAPRHYTHNPFLQWKKKLQKTFAFFFFLQ